MHNVLNNRQFRRLFIGRLVTNLGDSLYFVAAMWIVHELTGDPFYTGVAGFLTLLPGVFQFLAGPLVDEWPIRRTIVGAQVIQAVLVFTIPIADVLGVLSVEFVLVVMPLLAALNEFANPAMVAALPRLLDNDELVAANSAFSVANQGVDMIGNGLAGLLIGAVGAVALFAFDAITFGLAAILFATVTIPPAETFVDEHESDDAESGSNELKTASSDGSETEDGESYLDGLRLGVRYIRGTFLVWLLLGASLLNFTVGMALAAMPAYADTLPIPAALVAVGAAGAYGVLMASLAAGNLFGALAANLVAHRPFGRTLCAGLAVGGLFWSTAIIVNWLPATAILLVLTFVPVGIVNIQIAALVQSAPPEEIVGRVTSVLGSATVATIPVGSLSGGAVADVLGPQAAMLAGGIGLGVMAAYSFAHPGLRNLPSIKHIDI